ncbi:uncharacterized protein [Panulirus ornatus]|uniref:uncharacterized protein n=1 Tax=Panulirus ornatus TaxID=150431 RepID=UPI003A891D45
MKVVLSLLLMVVGLAVAQHFGTAKFSFQSPSFQQSGQNTFSGLQSGSNNKKDRNVHAISNGRQYHFSWQANPSRVFNGRAAFTYCSGLGPGWSAVGVSSRSEWNFLKGILESERDLRYFWMGGSNNRGRWTWATGERFGPFEAWSPRGGEGRGQPDNRDPPENCLGALKNVYNDGTTWHDINCRHEKHVVCEKA